MDTSDLHDEFERIVFHALSPLVAQTRRDRAGGLYRAVLGRVERPLLRHVLARAGGNQLEAARVLGINRNTLRKRLRVLGLLPERAGGGARSVA